MILSIGFSQVGVLIYEVYCHCKKETSISLHIPVNNCEVLNKDKANSTCYPVASSCCSESSTCQKDNKKKKPCSKETFKLFQLDSAKLSAEKNVDVDKAPTIVQTFLFASVNHQLTLLEYIQCQNPPDTVDKHSAFDQHTFIFIQSFLC